MNHLKFILTLLIGLTLSTVSIAQTIIKEKNNADPYFFKWLEIRRMEVYLDHRNSMNEEIVIYTCYIDERNKNGDCQPLVDEVVSLNELRSALKKENIRAGILGVGIVIIGASLISTGGGVAAGAATGIKVAKTRIAVGAGGVLIFSALGIEKLKKETGIIDIFLKGSHLRKLLSKKDVLFVRNIDDMEQMFKEIILKIVDKRK